MKRKGGKNLGEAHFLSFSVYSRKIFAPFTFERRWGFLRNNFLWWEISTELIGFLRIINLILLSKFLYTSKTKNMWTCLNVFVSVCLIFSTGLGWRRRRAPSSFLHPCVLQGVSVRLQRGLLKIFSWCKTFSTCGRTLGIMSYMHQHQCLITPSLWRLPCLYTWGLQLWGLLVMGTSD